MTKDNTRAVIDIGSNSLLLLVAERQGASWQPVFEQTRVTGLGAGTVQSGILADEPMGQSLETLKEFFQLARLHGASNIVAAATMAARIASNTQDFLDRADAAGTPFTILSGIDEADLGFRAIANDPKFGEYPVLSIIDPGGNSTELVTALRTENGWETLFHKSFPLGALGLRDTLMTQESPDCRQRLETVNLIDTFLEAEKLPTETGHAVVLGATGTNLVSIRDKLATWQPEKVHGATLDYEEVGRAVGWLCDMTDQSRAGLVGIEKGREKTIHIGTLILERFLNAIRVLECQVSIRGWRHAMLEDDQRYAKLETTLYPS